jgi:hypothetical protein
MLLTARQASGVEMIAAQVHAVLGTDRPGHPLKQNRSPPSV